MKDISINEFRIGPAHKPFIIAELSGNHNQSLAKALALVDAAAEAGVDAVKLQTYTADTMTIDLKENEFLITDRNSLWHGYSLYELYQKAYTPWEWHEIIFNRCREHGLIAFSTPFDATAVDFLESLHVPLYKIASFENTDIPLIQKVAATGKPVIISTGMASSDEINEAVKAARLAGCKDLILLKCTSNYPASAANSNLVTIPHMRELFDCEVGLSDHTLGLGVAIASVALGATVIEKHFTLNRSEGGVDAAFSLQPEEMQLLVSESKRAWSALGKVQFGPTEAEVSSLAFRRSLYLVEDVKAGEVLSDKNVRAIRPGRGLSPKFLPSVLGKKAKQDIKRGTPLAINLLMDQN